MRGLIHNKLRQYPAALAAYTQTLLLRPDPETLCLRGWVYLHCSPRRWPWRTSRLPWHPSLERAKPSSEQFPRWFPPLHAATPCVAGPEPGPARQAGAGQPWPMRSRRCAKPGQPARVVRRRLYPRPRLPGRAATPRNATAARFSAPATSIGARPARMALGRCRPRTERPSGVSTCRGNPPWRRSGAEQDGPAGTDLQSIAQAACRGDRSEPAADGSEQDLTPRTCNPDILTVDRIETIPPPAEPLHVSRRKLRRSSRLPSSRRGRHRRSRRLALATTAPVCRARPANQREASLDEGRLPARADHR